RSTPGGANGGVAPTVALFAGSGFDTVYISDANNTLEGIQGPFTITGQAGQDTLYVYDVGSKAAHTYTLTSTATTSTIQRSGTAAITYDNSTETVLVQGSNAVDSYSVPSPEPTIAVTLQGTGTFNTFVGPSQVNTLWHIDGQDAGQLGLVTFTGM